MNDKEAFEERAAILEYDANMPRAQAEAEAAKKFCPVCRTNKPRAGFAPVLDKYGKTRHLKCADCHKKSRRA